MKKQMFWFVSMAVAMFAFGPVSAEETVSYEESMMESSYDSPYGPQVVEGNYNPAPMMGNDGQTYERYEVRTTRNYPGAAVGAMPRDEMVRSYRYESNVGGAPRGYTNRSQMYRNAGNGARYERNSRTETTTKRLKRKYYLAHPFFQPTEGKFGSVTDLSYNSASYDLKLNPYTSSEISLNFSDTTGKWNMSQIALKEDFSYGITDEVALLALARYDTSKYKFEWPSSADDKLDDSGLNIYGAGVQWRFKDNEEWIATLSGYYERQKNVANEFVADIRAGYKVARSTIYGYARGWLMDFDNTAYGNGVVTPDDYLFIAYDIDVSKEFFFEAGLGVFSVLNKDWTFNVEANLGKYGWHNQGAIKGAFGWQPGDSFALNLYGRMAFYDSIENKDLDMFGTYLQQVSGDWVKKEGYLGTANISNYSEYSIGAQLIFLF